MRGVRDNASFDLLDTLMMRITAGVAMVLLVTAAPIGAGDAVFLRFADCRESRAVQR